MSRPVCSSGSFSPTLHARTTHQHAVVGNRARTRALSNSYAITPGPCWPDAAPCRCRARRLQVTAALFEPPPFQPKKLSVQYLAGARTFSRLSPPANRRYTLTHNDITGALQLSIGSEYNDRQVQGFYTRILRDEITAEWYFNSGAAAPAELHIYCHVSGEERWLAPPQLRNFIFRREMTLVLDTFSYADRELLQTFPDLQQAKVYVHFQSDVQDLDLREYWGVLGDRRSWWRMPRGVLARLKLLVFGFPSVPHQRPRQTLTLQQQERQLQLQQQQEQQLQEQQLVVAAVATAAGQMVSAGALDSSNDSSRDMQQQQQWHPQAESAVAPTRPVASSLRELRRQHPVQQLQEQQQQEQQARGLPTSALANGSGTGSLHVEQQQQQQQQLDQQSAGLVAAAQQLGAVVPTLPNSNGNSSGYGSSNGNNSSNGNGVSANALEQPYAGEQLQQQQEQVQAAAVLPEPAEVLQDYGYWYKAQRQQQQQWQYVEAVSSSSSSSSGTGGGIATLPLVLLDNSSTSLQVPFQQQLGMRPVVVAAAGGLLNNHRGIGSSSSSL